MRSPGRSWAPRRSSACRTRSRARPSIGAQGWAWRSSSWCSSSPWASDAPPADSFAAASEARGVAARANALHRPEADALLERVGMADLAEQGCSTLAYGDAKRIELALALGTAPKLLLMDEPTAGMPMSARSGLMQLARDLARRERIAVLFTEHDMDVVF